MEELLWGWGWELIGDGVDDVGGAGWGILVR